MTLNSTKISNRKTATRLLLINWSRFQHVTINLEGSTLITGVNGSGKSTILDALTYVLAGNTQFNKAAKDKERTVKAYVRGDTKSNGAARYLRSGEVVSYVAVEFFAPDSDEYFVVGVCMESPDEVSAVNSYWFVCRDSVLEDFGFVHMNEDNSGMSVMPKNMLYRKGIRLKNSDFLGKERGVEQVQRAMGLHCDAAKYRNKIVKMMAFNPENNIDQFIADCVLEPGNVDSLKELREQKSHFENLKKTYEDLRDGKEQLEKVEKRSVEYEDKKRALGIREMMLAYQEVLAKNEELGEIDARKKRLVQQINELEVQEKQADSDFEAARVRLQAVETGELYQDMQSSISQIEKEQERLKERINGEERETAKLLKLQNAFNGELSWLFESDASHKKGATGEDGADGESFASRPSSALSGDNAALMHLGEAGWDVEKKRMQFMDFLSDIDSRKIDLNKDMVHLDDLIKEYEEDISRREDEIKRLEANQMVYPEEVVQAQKLISGELSKRGVSAEVRIFADLVEKIKEPAWRKAIETFLGKKRFHIIVDEKYCHAALEILRDKKIYKVNVVLTDKLPRTDAAPGSAAEQLVIPNVYARQYANYLLNGIHLCENLEELHEYPKGGLTKDGLLAKSFSVSCMDMRRTSIYMGREALKLRLETERRIQEEKKKESAERKEDRSRMKARYGTIKDLNLNVSDYVISAPDDLARSQTRLQELHENVESIKNNPDFMAVIEEQQRAKSAYDSAKDRSREISERRSGCETDRKLIEERGRNLAGEKREAEEEYGALLGKNLELEAPMKAEYERARAKRGTARVITDKTVQNIRGELEECVKRLETEQLEYCKISAGDLSRRGPAYIPFYRQCYSDVANVKIEEAHSKLTAQAEKLESVFMNNFVSEMNEKILEAKKEIDAINSELKQIPFGTDTYRFKMEEKADRALFFRICKKLNKYMDSPEVYMNFSRDDEEMERDIQEFMERILDDGDETEYTDYRKYFTYDMSIMSRQGENSIEADLSKKQGSASNGEKQTPYFIILAASLMQYYPKKSCCGRLAFIDEAFSALSRERIEQMVRYLEENNFQVIYAAPPEKIGSIGQYIKSTVSLIVTGRFTNAVEGLVKQDDIG